jgi:hypothetical protein
MLPRTPHRKGPRQIYDHQKLHSTVFAEQSIFPEVPFAGFLDLWFDESGKRYDWAQIIQLLRDEEGHRDDAVLAFSRTRDLPDPPQFLSTSAPAPQLVLDPPVSSPMLAPISQRVPDPREPLSMPSSSRLQVVPDVLEIRSERTEALRPMEEGKSDILPVSAIQLDIFEPGEIPALIAGVLGGTNVNEFLERLGALACTGMHSDHICC